jgi:hypothetical protein
VASEAPRGYSPLPPWADFFFPESATCRDNLEQAKKVPEGREPDRCAELGRLHVHADAACDIANNGSSAGLIAAR